MQPAAEGTTAAARGTGGTAAADATPAEGAASATTAHTPATGIPAWRGTWGPLALIVGTVVAANLLYLLGFFDPNPLGSVSHLVTSTTAGLLPGQSTIDANSGFTSQALGHLAALDLLHGHLPWWDPFEGVGSPLAGEMQSAALFPLTLLLALPGGQLPFHVLLELATGVATWRLLLRLGVARWVAAGAGCAFALDGTFSWFQHAPVNPIALLPLLLLGVERARASAASGSGHRWGLVAAAVALSLYAGFPETAYLDGLLAVLWALARLWGLEGAAIGRYARKLAAGVVVGGALAAPIVVAFVDYLHSAYLGDHGSGFDHAALPHAGVASLLLPYVFGPIFGFGASNPTLQAVWDNVGGYLTTTLLIFGVIGCWSRRLRALRVVLVVWIVVGLGRIYGVAPLQHLFDLLPAMRQVAAYRYVPPSIELALVVLAALAIDDIRRRAVPAWYVLVSLCVSAAAVLGALDAGRGVVTAVQGTPHARTWVLGSLGWGLGMLAVVAVGAVALRGRIRQGVLVGCLVLDALAMFVVPELSAPRQATVDTRLVETVRHQVGDGRFFTLGPFQPNYGSYYRVGEAAINDLPIPKRYARAIVSRLDPNVVPTIFTGATQQRPTGPGPLRELADHEAAYEAIGVRVLLAAPGFVPASLAHAMGLTLVYSDGVADVYRLPRPAPLYSVVAGSCRLSHESVAGVTATCRGPATIVRRELAMPGWSATAGGRALTVSASGPLFQQVRVGGGTVRLRFTFEPPHEGAGLAALALGLVLLAAGWGLGVSGRRILPPLSGRVSGRVPGRVPGRLSGRLSGRGGRGGAPAA